MASGVRRRVQAGEILLAQGAVPDRALVMRDGRVKVTAMNARGRVAMLALRGPGAVLGEAGVVTGTPPSATVTAAKPIAYAAVGAERLRRAVQANADLALDAVRLLSERLVESDQRHADSLSLTLRPGSPAGGPNRPGRTSR